MLGIIYLISALVLGAAMTRHLGLKLLSFEAPSLSIALGFLIWTWLSFLISLVLPHNVSLPLTVIVAGALTGILLKSSKAHWQWQSLPGGPVAWLCWGAFSLITTIALGWLMWTHDLIARLGGLYSANATWADFGLHAALISHFAATPQLSMDFPLAAGTHLTYPLMVDLLSAWLVTGGWSLHLAIFVPSILLVCAFLQLMLGFGIRLFRSVGGMIAGLSLTLLCGSAAGVFQALTDYAASRQPLGIFLANLPADYTTLTTPNVQLTNMIADVLLPQRAFLMGFSTFAVAVILFTELRHRYRPRLAVFTGLLIGLLPFVHPHTFVVLMALATAFWTEAIIKTRRPWNTWTITGATALLVAAPQLLWETFANGTGTGGHFALGWVINPGESLIAFWTHNFGLTLPLIIAVGLILSLRPSLRRYLAWYLPFVLIFIFANVYSLQPFAYDNQKLLLYVYLATYIFASYGVLWLIRRHRSLLVPSLCLAALLTSSGLLAVAREFQHQDQFASTDDIALAQWVTAHTQPQDVFLTTDRPNQPIAALAGRQIVAGYRGWLYNYHLDYQTRLDTIQTGLVGGLTAPAPYGARYLAVSTSEPSSWIVDQTALTTRYHLLYENPSWTVYQLPQ